MDKRRIALIGRSHGGQTVLSTLDRTDKTVEAQPLQPKAAVALYPGCIKFERMWNYELTAPLLLMVGALDDWAPAINCENLTTQLRRRTQPIDLIVFPDSHHGFDSVGPVTTRKNLGNTRTGNATVGGNPAAREQAYRRMFDFLSAKLDTPLRLTHEQRFKGHRYEIPAASGFAKAEQVDAVPLGPNGRARYQQYLGLNPPKAFAVTEKRTWFFKSDDAHAMRNTLDLCAEAKVKCWLYAIDDRVVWNEDISSRVDATKLKQHGAASIQ